MSGLQLVFARTPAQEEALKKLIADQQDPRSPQYHRWLTPAEFGARFGASDATIAALSGWLRSQGLKVGRMPAGRDYLPFSGSKALVEAALHTQIHAFNIKGAQHYSNVTDPSVPASFKGVIAAIGGLNDFHPRPGIRSQPLRPATGGATAPRPDTYEGSIGANSYVIPGFVGPGDVARLYDLPPLYTNGITGTGVTVAIVAQSDVSASQLTAYWTAFGVTQAGAFSSIPVPTADGGSDPGQTNDGNEDEAYLDTEIIGGLAPGANLLLVRDKNAGLALQYIIDQDSPGGATPGVGIINISFGTCEAAAGAGNASINNIFSKAATEGITIAVSAGDTGADHRAFSATPGCMNSSDQGVQGDVASTGLAVSAFASSPYVLAVGGTDFDPNLEGTAGGTYWSTTNAVPTRSSITTHVPEMAWNTSCGNAEWSGYFAAASPLAFCNQATITTVAFGSNPNDYIEVLGGGGGVSSCTTMNAGACTGGYAQPAWQQNVPGISNFGGRAVPDVSAMATRWIICSYSDNPCTVAPNLPGGFFFFGTSTAAPVVAAIMALVDQSQQPGKTFADGRQGAINPLLYQLAATEYSSAANLAACDARQGAITNRACVFYDITLGSNAEPCSVASFSDTGSAPPSVCDNGGNAAFTTGLMTASSAGGAGSYPAGQGYDLASGLGSIDAANLIAAMSSLAAPTGLTATADASGITLQWNADAAATSFNLYQGTTSGQEGASAVQTGIKTNSTTLAQSGLTPGQKYYFEVAAVSGYGTSPNSAEASATAATPPAGGGGGGGGGSLDWLTLLGLGSIAATRPRKRMS
jgi:subtilase family serine protease